MKKTTVTLIALLSLLLATACGKVSGNEDQTKESNSSGVVSPLDPGAVVAGSPPAYVSHLTVSSTQFEVTLTKECTDATGLNSANFILSNGLQITGITKKPGDARTLVINTTIQQQISYNLTMLNLTGTDGGVLNGVLQLSFIGLPSPAITSIDWRNPADTANTLPANLGAIALCQLTSGVGANCTNAPFYNHAGVYGILTGANATAYRYKIDAGAWSAEIPKATPLNVSGLSEGYHTLYIIGKHSNGYWQSETAADVYTKSWVQDTIAPEAQLDPLTLPASVTASLSLSVRAVGADVSNFRYCLDNGTINDCVTNTWRGSPDVASAGLAIPNAVYTANLVPGSVRVRVIGIDASGNVQSAPVAGGTYSYTIDTGAVEAVFQLSDLTAITPVMTSVTVNVLGSSGAAAYKGKIVDGTDCNTGTGWDALPEQPLTTPITATGLTDTVPQKTVCAIGKSVSGLYWQGGWSGTATAPIITKYTWTIDTTPPTAIINWINPVTQPTTTTQTTGYELQISSTGAAVSYRYALVTGAGASCAAAMYNAEVTADTAITLGAPAIAPTGVTVYKVCVIGKDAAGNWQAVASASSTAEWTVDAEPPANNPSFAAASASVASFSTPVINFFIDNGSATADSQTYRVQVAKDTGFTQVISDTYVPSCKNIALPDCPAALGTKTFTIAVDPYTSGTVYARLQAGDAYGNFRSDFSAASAEHFIKGKITGRVLNSAGSALSGISVRIYESDGSPLNAVYPDQVTNASGNFTFSDVHTAKNRYRVVAAFADATYRPAMKRGLSVRDEGSGGTITTNIGSLALVTLASTTPQNIVAKIVDADDGWMLGYAEVKLIDWQGNTVGTAQRSVFSNNAYTDCDDVAPSGNPPTNLPKQRSNGNGICGDVTFNAVTPGTYSLQVTGTSWDTGNQTYNDLWQENLVVAGPAESSFLIIRGGGAATSTIYDPVLHSVRAGPTISGGAAPNNGTLAFAIPSGPFDGKYLLLRGNNTATTRVFNPIDISSSLVGPALSGNAGAGAHAFNIASGLHSGKVLIVHGNALTTTSLYDPATHTIVAGPVLPAAAGAGAHAFAITSGAQTGKTMVVHGNASAAASLYDPAAHTFTLSVSTLPANAAVGAFARSISTGTQAGKIRIVLGNATNNTAVYDPALDTFAAGSTLSGNAGAGAHAFAIVTGADSGKEIFVHGNAATTTSLYDPATDSFGIGPALSANAGVGGANILIAAGPQNGKHLVIHGNNTALTSLFDPSSSSFAAGITLSNAVNTGGFVLPLTNVSAGRLPLVRTLTGQDLKVVLSWGAGDPYDLDLHVVGTLPAGQTVTNVNGDDCGTGNNTLFHTWAARPNVGLTWAQQYSAKTRTYIQGNASYNASNYFPTSPDTTTALVQDTITGFGPEAINFIGGYTDGTYWFSVANWSQWFAASYPGADKFNQQWDVTNVEIRVYDANGLAFQMAAGAPQNTPDFTEAASAAGCSSTTDWQQCELWRAFKMTVSGTGPASRTFEPVNGYANWPDNSGTQDQSKCKMGNF
jgi:hypothetical protein